MPRVFSFSLISPKHIIYRFISGRIFLAALCFVVPFILSMPYRKFCSATRNTKSPSSPHTWRAFIQAETGNPVLHSDPSTRENLRQALQHRLSPEVRILRFSLAKRYNTELCATMSLAGSFSHIKLDRTFELEIGSAGPLHRDQKVQTR